jgi:KipI family sensor histidine kinase inhibitor
VHQWLAGQQRPEISEIVPGARTLLLRLQAPLPTDLARTMIGIDVAPVDRTVTDMITIDVRYDGPDLEPLADQLGIDVEQLIAHHTGQPWTVAFCGFSPGFGYLAPTERPLPVPRHTSPRTRVPAGSVALADQWSAIYPSDSPGGWQLIGSTDVRLFDVAADPPALLRPGSQVRFRRIAP